MSGLPSPTPAQLESSRLRLLADLEVLDTLPEAGFDALTHAARLVTGWPMAVISLSDGNRFWFKSRDGLAAVEVPREWAFCNHALLEDEILEVPDTRSDARFLDNPMVTGAPGIRAYVGLALVLQGVTLGALCVMHTEAAQLDADQRAQLRALAAATTALLAERLSRRQLVLERKRLADFGAASGDWCWETDAQLRVVWLSEHYELAMAQSPVCQLGLPLPDLPLLDTRGQPLQPAISLHALCAKLQAFSRALIAWRGNRGDRWICLSAVPLSDSEGRLLGLRGSARDVSEQVLDEQSREEEAMRLRKLVAVVPGALYQFRVDAAGQSSFPFATESLQTLLEVSPAAAAQSAAALFERIHPDDLAGFQQSIEASLTEMAAWQGTFRVCLPVAGLRYLSAHSPPQLDTAGGVVWHGLVTDVTTQVLERQEKKALEQQRDSAQRDSQARIDALSHLSHELRTPLNAILGFTQLMQAALRDDRLPAGPDNHWPQWLQQVHRAGSHLLALVNDVLDLSSPEARHFTCELQAVDADEVARQVVDMARPQALLRDHQLKLVSPKAEACLADQGGHWVLADKRALRQVLINLLGNACKYTPQGGHLELRLTVLPDQQLRMAVCDNGPGIGVEEQALLFQPYARGAQAGGQTVGTGLGLAISQQLVRAMHGRLTLESNPGGGSVFAVDLPLLPDSVRPDAANTDASSLFGALADEPHAQSPSTMLDALLLYVEDDPVNALLMQEFIARTPPLRLKLAVNLSQGLAAARQFKPQLLLLDMNLPDGSGYELLRQLRADPAATRMPVVALSADAMPHQVQKALAAGFDDYWTKPVDFQLLRKRLGDILNR